MASQALYRKWRSQTFDQIVGQEHVVRTLRNAIAEDRVAHAYLFTGPRGVGKTSMARLLAKAVNCAAAPPVRPCGECEACRAIAEGHAVDIIEMDAASHTSVEDARELIERVQFRPASGRFKVYVIDEVHMLSTAAFNALLKTLEEPPGHAIFILATTEVHKIPATILSRCQRFTFSRHTIAATAAHLQKIAAAEGITLEAGVGEAIARAATGSMRDALGVLEQLASFVSGPILLDQVQSLLGMTSAAEVDALIDGLIVGDTGAALRAVNGVADQGADIRQFTRDLVERLRALMLLLAAGDNALLDVGTDELQRLHNWADQADAAAVLHWIKLFSNLDFQLRTSPYGHLPLELAVVEALVAAPPAAESRPPARARPTTAVVRQPVVRPPTPAPSVRPAAAAPAAPPVDPAPAAASSPPVAAEEPPVSALPPAVEPEPSAVAAASPTVEEEPPVSALPPAVEPEPPAEGEPPAAAAGELDETGAVVPADAAATAAHARPADDAAIVAANAAVSLLEQVETVWPDVVRDVRPRDKMLQALLRDVRPADVEDDAVILLANSAFHKTQVEKQQNRRIIEDLIAKHLGRRVAIRCTTEERAGAQDLRGQIRASRKDPWVKAAMNIFDADVVGIEPDSNAE